MSNGKHRNVGAHRVVYELTHGSIPDGHYVCHRCDNPPCCNPAHLFVGTPKENTRDSVAKKRFGKPRYTYNDGAKNSHAKLTEAQANAILLRVAAGEQQKTIAASLSLDKGTIWRLVKGHTWKHLRPSIIRSTRSKQR